MKDYVVWLDSKNAHVFALKTTGIEKSVVRKNDKARPPHNKHDQDVDINVEHYYRDLATRLKDADHLLLMGPGLAKNQFKDHLAAHQAETLAKKIIGLENFESFEHKTEKQMMARARQFFKTYDLLNN